MKLLGNTINRIGMGCWAIGGKFFAGTDPLGFADVTDANSINTLHAAIDAGVNVFDTAAVYGAGNSETLIGKALKNHHDIIINSKLGIAFDEKTKQMLGPDTDPGNVATAIEASLSRLQRDHIDILFLHLNDLEVDTARPLFEKMENARERGLIRAYGWSTDFPDRIASMARMEGFIGAQHAMNVMVDVPNIQSTIQKLDLISFIRSPLAMGILSGKYDEDTKFSPNDNRAYNHEWREYFKDGKPSSHYLKTLGTIRELLMTGGRTVAQGSLCWLLAKSDRNVLLPGARTVEQVRENTQASEFGALPESVMKEIEAIVIREPEGAPRPR